MANFTVKDTQTHRSPTSYSKQTHTNNTHILFHTKTKRKKYVYEGNSRKLGLKMLSTQDNSSRYLKGTHYNQQVNEHQEHSPIVEGAARTSNKEKTSTWT